MITTPHVITAEELLKLPDDGFRYELVQGELRRMSPAGHRHGRLALNITTPLDQHVREHDLGAVYAAETGFQLTVDPDTVRAADVAFVRQERVEAGASPSASCSSKMSNYFSGRAARLGQKTDFLEGCEPSKPPAFESADPAQLAP